MSVSIKAKEKAKELSDYLKEKFGVAAELSGDTVLLTDEVGKKRAKQMVKKFLHQKELKDEYRVLVKGSEVILSKLKK